MAGHSYSTFTALGYRAVASVLRRATARPEHVLPLAWCSHTSAQLLVPPSARSAQGGTRQQTTARRHRGLLPIGSAQQRAVLLASTSQLHHLQALCGCVSSPPSAEHRSSLSGRGPLTERPSTRISHGRTMPASGSAGPGRWPASHVPTIARSRDFFFQKNI